MGVMNDCKSALRSVLSYIDNYLEKYKGREEENIDEFYNTITDFVNDYSDKYDDLNDVYYVYPVRVERKETLMSLFSEQVLPIDYSDYENINYFMSNIKDCDEWCCYSQIENRIVSWKDEAFYSVSRTKSFLEDIYEINFNKDTEVEL